MPNMKDLSLRVKKLWPMLKFFDGQTEGRTDRVITIGHPPGGGAQNNYNISNRLQFNSSLFPHKLFKMLLH